MVPRALPLAPKLLHVHLAHLLTTLLASTLPLPGSRWGGSRGALGMHAEGSGWQGGDPSPPPLRAPRGGSRPGPPAAEGLPMDPPPPVSPQGWF